MIRPQPEADQTWPSDEQLVSFFEQLRREGYRLIPQQLTAMLAVSRLARLAGSEGPPARLAYRLAPILAKSPDEQQDIYRRFRRIGVRIDRADEAREPAAQSDEAARRIGGHIWPIALGAVLIVAAAAFLVYWFSPVPPAPDNTVNQASDVQYVPPVLVPETRTDPIYHVVRLGLALLPLSVIVSWWLLRRRWRFLARGEESSEAYFDRLDLGRRPLSRTLFAGPELAAVSRQWRRFRRVPTRMLDEARTVAATIEQGGLFTPAYRTKPLSPEYRILVEESSRHDHLARLADNLLDRLTREGVALDRFYYQGDLERLRVADERHGEFTRLDRLESTDRSTLVIIGTGSALFPPLSTSIKPRLAEDLSRWEHRALLSTLPLADWSEQELALLDSGFALGTASVRGLRALGRHAQRGFPNHEKLLEGVLASRGGPRRKRADTTAESQLPTLVTILRSRVEEVGALRSDDTQHADHLFDIRTMLDRNDPAAALDTIDASQRDGLFDLGIPKLLAAIRAALGGVAKALPSSPAPLNGRGPDRAGHAAQNAEDDPDLAAADTPTDLFSRVPGLLGQFFLRLGEPDSPRLLIITGLWGSGKSTYLHLISRDAERNGRFKVVDLSLFGPGLRSREDFVRAMAERLGLDFVPGADAEELGLVTRLVAQLAELPQPTLLLLDDGDRATPELHRTISELTSAIIDVEVPMLWIVIAGYDPLPDVMAPSVMRVEISADSLRSDLLAQIRDRYGPHVADRIGPDMSPSEIMEFIAGLERSQ